MDANAPGVGPAPRRRAMTLRCITAAGQFGYGIQSAFSLLMRSWDDE